MSKLLWSELLDEGEQAELQCLQNPSRIHGDISNNAKREISRIWQKREII